MVDFHGADFPCDRIRKKITLKTNKSDQWVVHPTSHEVGKGQGPQGLLVGSSQVLDTWLITMVIVVVP